MKKPNIKRIMRKTEKDPKIKYIFLKSMHGKRYADLLVKKKAKNNDPRLIEWRENHVPLSPTTAQRRGKQLFDALMETGEFTRDEVKRFVHCWIL